MDIQRDIVTHKQSDMMAGLRGRRVVLRVWSLGSSAGLRGWGLVSRAGLKGWGLGSKAGIKFW